MFLLFRSLPNGYFPTHQGLEVFRADCRNGRDDGLFKQGIREPYKRSSLFRDNTLGLSKVGTVSCSSSFTPFCARPLLSRTCTDKARCVSSSELRLELGLNQPNPLGFTYPTFFPALPMEQLSREESRVWYFYLAETAIRRLTMRIIQLFFRNQTQGRFPDAYQLRESSLDFEVQASEW